MIPAIYTQPSGDFEEIYGVDSDPREPHSGQWDSVLTCFFIDTVSLSLHFRFRLADFSALDS